VALLPWPDARVVEDVDTPEDYQRLLDRPVPAPGAAARRRG